MSDARFEDGREAPLNLGAQDAEDIGVLSALVQDSVLTAADMQWEPARRRFSLLLNRFRWEDGGADRHAPERVRSVLVIDNVMGLASQGIDRGDKDLILSLLSVGFEQDGEGPEGHILLTLAGDGAIRARVEAPELRLKDVTKPYRAPSGKRPDHG
ncbi:DUF2948 family protein [Pseudooceanicola sp. MF1-13]|uniref:DUF2948 family protein n=1 Tax=Pseudooceanicola sp. MF1-13 TaxID=3379095 RepID=UPI0038912894